MYDTRHPQNNSNKSTREHGAVVMYLDFRPSVPGSIPGVDGKNG